MHNLILKLVLTTTTSTSTTVNLTIESMTSSVFISSTEKSTSINEETAYLTSIPSTLKNEISLSTSPDIFFFSDRTSVVSSSHLTTQSTELPKINSSTSEIMTTIKESTNVKEETTHLASFTNEIRSSPSTTEKLSSTFTTPNITLTLFEDFCPGTRKTLDCSSVGGKVELIDAFYGISSEMPPVCVYK